MSTIPFGGRIAFAHLEQRPPRRISVAAAVALAALLGCASRAGAIDTCAGDCNGDGAVSADETLIGANLALGTLSLRACPTADASGDGTVSVGEAVAAVGRSVSGCGAHFSANALAAATGPAQIELGVVTGSAGAQVTFDATLHDMGNVVAGTENVIAFDPLTPIIGCQANPAISKSVFSAFRPLGCTIGLDCTSIKLLVLSLSDVDPIPDGSVLYSCTVGISFVASDGTYPLDTSLEGASTPDGQPVATEGIDGAVVVVGGAICAGDCDGNGAVTINELVTGVNILLGYLIPAACPAGDFNGDGAITVDESETAIGNAYDGCGTHPSGPPSTTPISIALGVVSGTAGTQVSFDATVQTMGESVSATQNDIFFDPTTPIVSCAGNPAIDKNVTEFAFMPNGCTVGVDCFGVRALVLSFANFDPIPDGATLYTCTIAISSFAPDGFHPLFASNLHASTPGGRPIHVFGIDGGVNSVGGMIIPTPTPTPPVHVTIIVGDTMGVPGQTASFDVGLETDGDAAATENELTLGNSAPIVFSSCAVNPAINKPSSFFAFRPDSCLPGVNCSGVKAIILSFFDLSPIPNGSTMYSCDVAILPNAPPGNYLIDCFAPGASDPVGNALPTQCTDGHVTVLSPGPPVADATLILSKARLRAATSGDASRPNGSIQLSGVVNTNSPFGDLAADITATGVTVAVSGAGGADHTLSWTAEQCASQQTHRGPRLRCDAADGDGKRRLLLRPLKTPNLLRLKISSSRLVLPGPFTAAPVAAMLTTTSFQRPDSIGGCSLQHQGVVTSCRESGIVP